VIRTLSSDDTEAVFALVVAAGLFTLEEAPLLVQMLEGYEDAARDEGHVGIVDEGPDGLSGVAYYRPRPVTDRVWDLTMIAVRPDLQGHGRGRALLAHVEDDLRARGQRLLTVDTSGTAQYDRTRDFYRHCGYAQEARIRDYWQDGDDLVVFTKRIEVRPPR
jgi:ribosomal protein S18 acetylase RimI-like enzyme